MSVTCATTRLRIAHQTDNYHRTLFTWGLGVSILGPGAVDHDYQRIGGSTFVGRLHQDWQMFHLAFFIFLLHFERICIHPGPSLTSLFNRLLGCYSSIYVLNVRTRVCFGSTIYNVIGPLCCVFAFTRTLRVFGVNVLGTHCYTTRVTFGTTIHCNFHSVFKGRVRVKGECNSMSRRFNCHGR